MEINEVLMISVKIKICDEIKKLANSMQLLNSYHISHTTPTEVKMHKWAEDKNKIEVVINKIDVGSAFGFLEGGAFNVTIIVKSPHDFPLYNLDIISKSCNLKDVPVSEFISHAYDFVEIHDDELVEHLNKLMKRCEVKKERDNEERDYNRVMSILNYINKE